jgi:carboxypeptidase Taq
MIGRSGSFWDYYFPQFKELFPLQLANVDEGQFLAAINRVKATPIRVDADEVTYGLHIIARFELEKALLKGDLKVKDLSGAWAEKMEKLLNIKVKSDRLGVLQDVHWSMGVFGYFPTYALGNLYGAQISAIMANEIDLDYHLKRGELTPIREWLEAKILKYGALYQPKELLNKVTGSPLRSSHFKEYLTKKYLEI